MNKLQLVPAALCVAALLGTASVAAANPPDAGPARLSNSAVLTQGPVSRVAASADEAPPADVLGSPANSMIVRSDQLLISDRVYGSADHAMSAQRVTVPQLTFDKVGARNPETVRPLVHVQYPTAAGRFLDPAADKVLAFRHQAAGDDGLWTLSNVSSAADRAARKTGKAVTTPNIGHTYTMNTDIPVVGVYYVQGAAGDIGAAVVGNRSGVADNTQWSVVPGSDPGYFRLVSLSDGLCLDALGGSQVSESDIGTYPCQEGAGHANQEWYINNHDHLTNRNSGLVASMKGPQGGLVQETEQKDFILQTVTFTETTEPQGVIPTVSFGGDLDRTTPYDLAGGDLDRVADPDTGGYRDEAVVVWGEDHDISLRVVDYSRPGGGVTITAPDKDLTASIGDAARPGSLNVAVGDFDGAGLNEIAVTWQDNQSLFHVAFLSYAEADGQPKLTVTHPDQLLMSSLKDAPTPTRTSGMADLIAGDFDGAGRASLALGWAGKKSSVVSGYTAPFLTVVRFDANLKPVAAQWNALGDDKVAFKSDPELYAGAAAPDWTENGIRLAAGVFDNSEPDLHRRQIASVARVHSVHDALAFLSTGLVGVSRQVTVHRVTVPNPNTPDALAVDRLTDPMQLPDSGVDFRPVSLAAGGFGGQGDPGDVPVWGLAVSQSEPPARAGQGEISYVQMMGVDAANHALTKPYRTADQGDRQYTLTAYDYAGESLMLGAPTRFTYENMPRVNVVAAQPPAHADWLGGGFVNVSRTPDLNVSMSTANQQDFSSTRTDTTGRTLGVGEHSSFQISDKVGIPDVFSIAGSLKVGQKMDKEWDSESKDIASNSHKQETKITSSTADDDIVNGETKTTYVYRYPILNQKLEKTDGSLYTDPSCPDGCYGQFEVSLPGAVVRGNFGGRDVDWYSPTWQNGNALSYPDAGAKTIYPAGDLGSYSYLDDNNAPQTQSGLLFDSSNTLGGVKHNAELQISDTVGGGHDRTSKTTLTNSAFLDITEKVQVLDAKFVGKQGTDLSDKTTHGNITVGETSSSTANAFALEIPQIESTQAYRVRTSYYYDKSGAQKVIHGVDMTSSTQGRQWWQTNYGQQPDPALNLPNAMVTTLSKRGVYDDLAWNASPGRQRIRGFNVLDDSGAISRQNPVAGAKVRFQAQVHNFSLKAAGATPVRWFAVPVDDLGLEVTGKVEPIGATQTISGIGAREMVTLTSPEWTSKATGGDDKHWRIFVQLDPDGSLTEIHPLNGTACPDESTTEDKALVDPMTGQQEVLACGQNNQGYGDVVVAPDLPGAEESGAPDLDGSTLVHPGQPLLGDAPGAVSQVVVGQQLTGVVKAKSDGGSRAHQRVVIYDGDPDRGGQGIASTTMHGTAAGSGYATFSWTPKTPGVHVLYQKLIGRTATDGHSVQTLTVNVAAHGDPATIQVVPKSSASSPGHPVEVAVKAYDVQGNLVGDVTDASTLTISPDGACATNRCTPAAIGPHLITATNDAMTATASIEVNAPVGTAIAITGGNFQSAAPGKAFAKRLSVQVKDQYGYPIVGQPVGFTVTAGSARFGKANAVSATTDTRGMAISPRLEAGKTVGPVAVQATAGSASALFVAAITAEPVRPADLAVKVQAPSQVKVGKTFTAKATVTNKGPGRAGDVLLAVSVPNRLSIRSDGPGHRVGNVVFYRVSSVKNDQHRTFTLKLRARTAGPAKIVATTMSTAPDPHRSNNIGTDTVRARR